MKIELHLIEELTDSKDNVKKFFRIMIRGVEAGWLSLQQNNYWKVTFDMNGLSFFDEGIVTYETAKTRIKAVTGWYFIDMGFISTEIEIEEVKL